MSDRALLATGPSSPFQTTTASSARARSHASLRAWAAPACWRLAGVFFCNYEINADDVVVVEQRYPSAGEPNVVLQLGILELASGEVRLEVSDETDGSVVVADAVRWKPVSGTAVEGADSP